MSSNTEFLPLCDVLFNVISLAEYFCHVVFDIVYLYALFVRDSSSLAIAILFIILGSLIASQIVSLKWYLDSSSSDRRAIAERDTSSEQPATNSNDGQIRGHFESQVTRRNGRYIVFALHTFQLGILWRYTKLFVPVNLALVKRLTRDLCMLRLLHAFCESAPMLLLQLHVLVSMRLDEYRSESGTELRLKVGPIVASGPHSYPKSAIILQKNRTFTELNTISAILSLFSICWALASFSKNVRLQNVNRLVLTWLGVIFQFFWRLGTVVSRVTALTVYASLYKSWIFLVIVLHWFSMLLWLISPKNVFHGENISRVKKATLSAMIAFVYVFAYINLQEVNPRQKMVTFYVVMFLENLLLVCLWLVGIWPERGDKWMLVPLTVVASFAIGILFMITYYRYFHVRRLGFDSGGDSIEEYQSKNKSCGSTSYGVGESGTKYNSPTVPGVFNCRFSNPVNGAAKRKKKKPTSFVPPPNLKIPSGGQPGLTYPNPMQVQQPQHPYPLSTQEAVPQSLTQYCHGPSPGGGPMAIPFWKQPLVTPSQNGSSENESSVGSRVNIQQKLHEKKQKQLAELKVIEEEIKQGKLVGPHLSGTLSSNEDTRLQSLPRQPIPQLKKHDLDPAKFYDVGGGYSNMMMLQSHYDDPCDVDAAYGTTYVVDHQPLSAFNQTNNLNMPPTGEGNSRAVIAKSKVPRTFHQNIHAHTGTPSPTVPGHHQGPDTNSNKSGSNPRANLRPVSGMMRQPSPNVAREEYMVPSQKMDSNRATPIQNAHVNTMMNILHRQQQQQQQQHRLTPSQVLLRPHPYLEQTGNSGGLATPAEEYYNWKTGSRGGSLSSEDEEDNTHNLPSDIDSQMSLPRSYTLPREFKYYRRTKSRKMDNFVASNNSSSDADVDSADDNDSPMDDGHAGAKYYYHNMSRRQQQATGRVSVPAVGNQPIYLNSPPPHSYVRNLDLISNVLDGPGAAVEHHLPTGHRQHLPSNGMRRMRYPGHRGGNVGAVSAGFHEVRHETKL